MLNYRSATDLAPSALAKACGLASTNPNAPVVASRCSRCRSLGVGCFGLEAPVVLMPSLEHVVFAGAVLLVVAVAAFFVL